MQAQAEALIKDNEYDIDSMSVLSLAAQSGCSAYDCELVSLSRALNTKLITADNKLIESFPDIALTARGYISGVSE